MSFDEFLKLVSTSEFDEEKAKQLQAELKELFIEQAKQTEQLRLTTKDLNRVCDL